MGEQRYRLMDVFTREQFQGNQLAVFPDGRLLDAGTMQRIARELNLPETTFVFPASMAGCIADVRIFTPQRELVFAGHPTIGTAAVLINEGRIPASALEFQLQEKIGPVAVRVGREDGADLIWLRTPPIQWQRTFDPSLCAGVLGLEVADLLDEDVVPQRLSAGNPTLFVALRDPGCVDRAWLGSDGMRRLAASESEPFCVFVFAPTAGGAYSRMFAPDYGIQEDPATGSATGPLAAYMMKYKLVSGTPGSRFVSEQGTKMLRRSILHVQVQGDGAVDVGGYATPVGEGRIRF